MFRNDLCRTSILLKDSPKSIRYLSYAVSAPIIAAISFVVLGLVQPGEQIIQIAISLLFASVLPIAGIVYFARSEKTNLNIPDRNLRAKPFGIAIISYSVGSLILLASRAPIIMAGLMLAYAINTSIMMLVTRYWRKASIHAAGVMGPVSFLVYQFGIFASVFYLLVVPVGLIRLKMSEHTAMEVVAGALIALVATWLQLLFLIPSISLIGH